MIFSIEDIYLSLYYTEGYNIKSCVEMLMMKFDILPTYM